MFGVLQEYAWVLQGGGAPGPTPAGVGGAGVGAYSSSQNNKLLEYSGHSAGYMCELWLASAILSLSCGDALMLSNTFCCVLWSAMHRAMHLSVTGNVRLLP
jgi:hypothetical protein